MTPREALAAAGFEPDFNVCALCLHHGGRHDLNNKCLDCGDYFGSMTPDQEWEYGLDMLAAHGYVLTPVPLS
jgi:hypothetical protein